MYWGVENSFIKCTINDDDSTDNSTGRYNICVSIKCNFTFSSTVSSTCTRIVLLREFNSYDDTCFMMYITHVHKIIVFCSLNLFQIRFSITSSLKYSTTIVVFIYFNKQIIIVKTISTYISQGRRDPRQSLVFCSIRIRMNGAATRRATVDPTVNRRKK